MMIELKNVFITFNKSTAIENSVLKGLSLTVGQGEFVSVIGSNGAGKSTMLNAISGDCSVDSGEILIQGQNVNQSSSWQRANRVARVFQDPMAGTCEDLTIEENMALAYQRGQKRGFSFAIKRQQREIFREKLALLGLGLKKPLNRPNGAFIGRSAASREPIDGFASTFKHSLAGRTHRSTRPKNNRFCDATD